MTLCESQRATWRVACIDMPLSNSATLQIEGKTVCIRDDKQWKSCSGGHETTDWVKQIEDAYLRKNPDLPTLSARHNLQKRQGPPLPGNGTSSSPAPSASQTNDNGQQGAPLSVFVSNLLRGWRGGGWARGCSQRCFGPPGAFVSLLYAMLTHLPALSDFHHR